MGVSYVDRMMDIGPYILEDDDDLVICRCEEITKGEIRKAIHDGMTLGLIQCNKKCA